MMTVATLRLRGPGLPLGAVALGIGAIVAAAVWAVRATGMLQGAELALYDAFAARRAERSPPEARIALVRIREEEIAQHGHPLPDAVLADALARIAAQGPRAIGVDLYRVAPTDAAKRQGWEALGQLASDPRMVFIEKLSAATEPGVPAPVFADAEQVGFSDLPIDPDGVLRRGLLFLWDEQDRPQLSLSLQLALRFLNAEDIGLGADPERPEVVRLGATSLPPFESHDGSYVAADAGGYQILLDLRRAPGTFPEVALDDVLAGRTPEGFFANRVVLVGTTAPSVKDEFRTAHSAGAPVLGIEVHAHVVDQLLRTALDGARPPRFFSEPVEAAWLLAWSLAGALLARFMRAPAALAVQVVALVGALTGTSYALFLAGWWVPLAPPALASLGSAGLVLAEAMRRERVERAAVMDLFGRYVSRGVAEELWTQRAEFMDGGRPRPQRLIVTTMLTDLKGYTSAAEKMDPTDLMAWVNEYMDAMTEIIEEHRGFVDDYTGDGIKANFGVPIARATPAQIGADAWEAVNCALDMGAALERLCAVWRAEGRPEARMRIGLNTGEVIAGSNGSARRMKYTTVGDTVNAAARLEGFRKEDFEGETTQGALTRFRILVGESTRVQLGDAFDLEFLGAHALRGRGEPIGIYRVRGPRAAERRDGGAT